MAKASRGHTCLAPWIELMSMIYSYDLHLASATVCRSSSLLCAQQAGHIFCSLEIGKLSWWWFYTVSVCSQKGKLSWYSAWTRDQESTFRGLISVFPQTLLLLYFILFAFALLGPFENEAKPSGGWALFSIPLRMSNEAAGVTISQLSGSCHFCTTTHKSLDVSLPVWA